VPIDEPSSDELERNSADAESLSSDGDQTLSDSDQSLSDSDQSAADLDQTSADADQGASERDQLASDRDQHAADLDQAASDKVQNDGAGPDPATYARTRRTRAQTTLERDLDTHTRSEAARIREATAARRDRDAEARDAAAAARDQLATTLDAEIERLEKVGAEEGNGAVVGLEILLRASRDRKRAAASRGRAAVSRGEAARDRDLARQDRLEAAVDRRAAAEELAAEGLDHLTGTLRRRVGLVAIQREIDRTRRTHEPLVVTFVDVDGLKVVNDTHGHDAGDDLLVGVARCIKAGLRRYDVIMRFGGDEFVCSLSGQDLVGVERRFDQIASQIAKTQRGATITVGFAEGQDQETLDEVIVRADRQMISARRGRA
jgi:diguanylate cyclase (GGDEF)-like protein